ncbi:hypothetical protein FOPE_10930 [Fonsecaea pedrosoi]|nr:hypothetical protein FOPE_10930 [Fonsecaea pedrosoi]
MTFRCSFLVIEGKAHSDIWVCHSVDPAATLSITHKNSMVMGWYKDNVLTQVAHGMFSKYYERSEKRAEDKNDDDVEELDE